MSGEERTELACAIFLALLSNPSLLAVTPNARLWDEDAVALIPVSFQLADAFAEAAQQRGGEK